MKKDEVDIKIINMITDLVEEKNRYKNAIDVAVEKLGVLNNKMDRLKLLQIADDAFGDLYCIGNPDHRSRGIQHYLTDDETKNFIFYRILANSNQDHLSRVVQYMSDDQGLRFDGILDYLYPPDEIGSKGNQDYIRSLLKPKTEATE